MQLPKKEIFVFFSSFLFLINYSIVVCAIGISPADAYVNFVPNYEYIIDYSITSYKPFEFYTEGPFSQYTRIEELYHTDTHGSFRVHLLLPAEYETPGKHRMYIAAKEKPSRGTVNTIAGIRGFVEIDVPFPGYYAEMELSANDVNAGEPVFITVTVKNSGRENITDARLELSVLSGEKTVKTMQSDQFSVETTGSYVFEADIAGGELKPGKYKLKADLFYAGEHKEKIIEFKVGSFDVAIVNHTRTMFNNSVNLFDIDVESRWNNPISTLYMDLSIMNGSKSLSAVKTPPFDLPAWETKRSSLYWNTEGVPVGEYDLGIVLHYDEGVKTENRKIFIVDKPAVEAASPVPTFTIVLIIVVLVLIGFNIYMIVLGKKRREKEDEGKDG